MAEPHASQPVDRDRLGVLADELQIALEELRGRDDEGLDLGHLTAGFQRAQGVLDEIHDLPGLWSAEYPQLRRAVRWLERGVDELAQTMDTASLDGADERIEQPLAGPDATHRLERVIEWFREVQLDT